MYGDDIPRSIVIMNFTPVIRSFITRQKLSKKHFINPICPTDHTLHTWISRKAFDDWFRFVAIFSAWLIGLLATLNRLWLNDKPFSLRSLSRAFPICYFLFHLLVLRQGALVWKKSMSWESNMIPQEKSVSQKSSAHSLRDSIPVTHPITM